MATINSNDVVSAIASYIEKNARPCPAHYLTQKFGDDVSESITNLKKDGKVVGRRGRNGGIVLPDTVLPAKAIDAKPISIVTDQDDSESSSDNASVPF